MAILAFALADLVHADPSVALQVKVSNLSELLHLAAPHHQV
jgi:hypothetical protein